MTTKILSYPKAKSKCCLSFYVSSTCYICGFLCYCFLFMW